VQDHSVARAVPGAVAVVGVVDAAQVNQLLELAASARSAANESDSPISGSQFFAEDRSDDEDPDAEDLLLRIELLDRRMEDSARALKELVRQQRIVADVLQRMAVQLEQLAHTGHIGISARRASA